MELTAQDIKAMRLADRVCFYSVRGKGSIRCVKVLRNSGPYDDRERDYTKTASPIVC